MCGSCIFFRRKKGGGEERWRGEEPGPRGKTGRGNRVCGGGGCS